MDGSQYGTVLISREQIKKRVHELGAEITKDYIGKKLLIVGILNGCVYFLTDLSLELGIPAEIDFISASSYGNSTESNGSVKIKKDTNKDISGYDVLIVEDIIDTGYTLNSIKKLFSERNASSIKICTLINKPSRRTVDVSVDYVGFNIPDEFIIGYGLDYAGQYRNLKDILIIKPELVQLS